MNIFGKIKGGSFSIFPANISSKSAYSFDMDRAVIIPTKNVVTALSITILGEGEGDDSYCILTLTGVTKSLKRCTLRDAQ